MWAVVRGGWRHAPASERAPLRAPRMALMFIGTNWPAPGVATRTAIVPTPTSAPLTMRDSTSGNAVLIALRNGDERSLEQVVSVLYDELRVIAHRQLARTRPYNGADRTMVTTALVNEAYLRLVDQQHATPSDRTHFLALASVAMRHVLIDRARAQAAERRGGGQRAVTLDDAVADGERSPQRLLEIDDALDRLAAVSPRLARVVECRFYGGLSEEEIAEALSITVRTVQRDWVKARALLRRALSDAVEP